MSLLLNSSYKVAGSDMQLKIFLNQSNLCYSLASYATDGQVIIIYTFLGHNARSGDASGNQTHRQTSKCRNRLKLILAENCDKY